MNYLRFLRDNANWLAAGFLLAFTSSYGQTFFISIFSAEVMQDFGLSHGQWGLSYTLGTTVSAAIMLWAGALTDRFRVRALAPVVFAGLALSCAAMALNAAAWAVPLIILALRFFGQGMCSQLASVSMARWFSANRGRALAISSLGFAVGTALLPYLFVQAKAWMDWRALWLVAALMALAAILPLWWLLRRERTPQSIAQSTETAGMGGRHWTRLQMLRGPLFWLVLPSILGPAAWNTALFFQQVHLAQVKGWDHADFVALLPMFTLVSVLSTFASGALIDRFGAGWLMALQALPSAAGYFVMAQTDGLGAAAVGMGLLALSTGGMATLPGAFAAEFYGTRHLGGIKAIWAAAMVLGSAIGPGVTGVLIDAGVDFPDQMTAIALFFLSAGALVALGVARARLSPATQIDI